MTEEPTGNGADVFRVDAKTMPTSRAMSSGPLTSTAVPRREDLLDISSIDEVSTGIESASDVVLHSMLKKMQEDLCPDEPFVTDRMGRAAPMDVIMAVWMKPEESEVPVPSRVGKWVEQRRKANMMQFEFDYHPMDDTDVLNDWKWCEENSKECPTVMETDEDDLSELIAATKMMTKLYGEPLLGYEMNERETDESVNEHDPRPEMNEILIQFLDDEYGDLNAADVEEEKEFVSDPFEAALDSGAGEHVADDSSAAMYAVQESAGSKADQNFVTAGGGRLKNRGEMKLDLRADNGKKGRELRMTFQVAKVTKPLLSVSKICDAGFTVTFNKEMAVVLDAKGKEVCRFLRRRGLYVASMQLRNPKFKPKASPFARPDAK